MRMKVFVGNEIMINNPSADLLSWARINFNLDNPDYYKKQQMGKWTGNTPRQISLYKKVGENLFLPFGCLRQFYSRYPHEEYKPLFSPFRHFDYKSDIKPYDYQEKAIQAGISKKNGILVMPCGSGKTQCGIEIISRLQGRALWLTHTGDLLNQSKERAKSVLGCELKAFGTITGGKVNISEGITFATVQTMAKLDLAQYKNTWDIIIVDECQHCAGTPTRVTQFYKVVNSLCARYKIGLTATPHRADGLEQSMYALLGGIIYEVSKDDVKDTTCPVNVAMYESNYTPNYDAVLAGDGTINYSQLVDDLINNEDRFKQVSLIAYSASDMGATLILANRVEYLKRMSDMFNRDGRKSICLSAMGTSKKAKQERKNALKALNNGEIDCIFATYQLAKEGLDVPNLRYVVLATPEKDSTTVMQSAGRVGRKAEGKEYGTVIDFEDNFGMYKGWARKRLGYYKKLGYNIY